MADHAPTNWIDFFVALVPMGQTAIWASVALVAVIKFQAPVRGLAEKLIGRVGQGDSIKTPWISIERARNSESIVSEVNAAVDEAIAEEFGGDKDNALAFNVSRMVKDRIAQASVLTIVGPEEMGSEEWKISYDSVSDVSALLDYVYFKLRGVKAFTYGASWILHNERENRLLEKKGDLKTSHHPAGQDLRRLSAAGIQPGDRLRVILLE
jgi:hypothetical protein